VRDSLEVHGRRYIERVYTEVEQDDCGADPGRLAARFAAKEALIKALGLADRSLPWRSIGVVQRPGGQVALELTGPAEALADRLALQNTWVSLTRERMRAAAVVLVELREER
jgi:holo-[acyl-carrier protein] synthase